MKEKIDLKTVLIIILPITAMALGYFLFFHSPEIVEKKSQSQSIPIPASEVDELSESKSKIYQEKLQREAEQERQRSRSQVSERDFFSMVRNENGIQEKPVETEQRPATLPEPAAVTNPAPAPAPARVAPAQTREPERVQEAITANNPAPRSGFGILVSENQNTESNVYQANGETDQGKIEGFIPAVLEETVEIKTGSSVVFIVGQEFWHQGHKINRNALLFGKAQDAGRVFEIVIEQIKNTNGQILAANNLRVFDERYSQGLPHAGALNQAIREGTNQGTGEASRDLTRTPGSTGTVTGTALNVFDRTVNSMTRQRQRENSVSLHKGYRVYIKQID